MYIIFLILLKNIDCDTRRKFSDKTTLIFFHIFAQNIDCGYSLEPPRRGDSYEYPQSIFWAETWEISEFLSEIFHFFGGKIFSIGLFS